MQRLWSIIIRHFVHGWSFHHRRGIRSEWISRQVFDDSFSCCSGINQRMTPQPWLPLGLAKTPPDPIQAHPASSTQLSMHHLPFIKALEPFIISDSISNFCRLKRSRSIPFPAAAHTHPPSLCFSPFPPKVNGWHRDYLNVVSVWREASYISHFSKPPSQWDGNLTWLLVNLNNVGDTWLFVSVPAMKWCLFSLKKIKTIKTCWG